jgi:LPXTG-site transpeptidase (sortase) family protein
MVYAALLAIVSSLVLWTSAIDNVPLPQVPQKIVTQFDEFLQRIFKPSQEVQTISVKEIMIEDLGAHFASSVEESHIRASVLQELESIVDKEQETVQDQPVVHGVATELEQWGIARAWSITIPSLGIRAPVLLPSMKNWSLRAWDMLEEQMQVGLNHGAVAYPNSSGPGRKGNLIIAGHSSPPTESARKSEFGSLFSLLPDIKIGEVISITTAGSPITYRVFEKTIVSPQMTSILEQQSEESILKVITCFPVGSTRDRLVVLAKKIDE